MRNPAAALLLLALTASPLIASADDARPELLLGSVHAAVFDIEDGEMLHAKYADRVVPIASITKLMMALVVLDSGEPLDEWLRVVERHKEPPVNAWSRIRIGSELRRGDLLRIALMASENLASYVLARHHPGGYDAFVEAMNAKARELGMDDTRFVDPSGLSDDNHSTARDLVRLLVAAREQEAIVDASRTAGYVARFRRPRYTLGFSNTNVLVHWAHWDIEVSKSGYLDAAGRCLAVIAHLDDRPVAMVMLDSLGTRTPVGDAGRIKRWLATGASGSVAGPALRYERERSAIYEQARE